jgi:hypothetical protein
MKTLKYVVATVGALGVTALVATGHAQKQPPPTVQIPQPGVPQIMTLEAEFVRVAYNNEAYAIMGYKVTQYSVGEEWIMLDLGLTMMEKAPTYRLKRQDMTLTLPDDSTLPLPTIAEYRENESKVQAMQQRWKVQHDSIDYFPPWVSGINRLGFFADMGQRAMPWDEADVSKDRACVGQLYFHIPGGLKYGQHWLNIKFAQGPIRVPFRIFTKEEEKTLTKNYTNIKKQVEAAFKKKK